MTLRRTALAAVVVAALSLVGTVPASAAEATLTDPAGDATGPGLDITDATVVNRDYVIVVRVRFVEAARGDLVVSVDPRKARGVRIVSRYRPLGHTDNLLLAGAFTDRMTDGQETTVLPCHGLRVRWSPDTPTARLRMPARCLHGGNYGAVRVAVLTERSADTDFAPEGRDASSWVPRG